MQKNKKAEMFTDSDNEGVTHGLSGGYFNKIL